MSKTITNFKYRFREKTIELDYDIVPTCDLCGKPMKIQSRSRPRHVVGVGENYQIVKVYRVCGNSSCPGCLKKPIFVKNPHVKPRCSFDIEVQALVCELRWKHHKTEEEIIEYLLSNNEIEISLAKVGNILKMYEIGCTLIRKESVIATMKENGGIIFTIDAMEPLKGEKAIYMVRDELTGTVLAAKQLPNGKMVTIKKFLQNVKKYIDDELGVPVLAIMCDAQKEQKAALESVFPGVKICLCGFHFYKGVLKAPMSADSTLMKTIRSILRNIPTIKEYRLRDAENQDKIDERGLVDDVLDLLLNLSNWTKKPRDPCFSGLELRDRVKDVSTLVNEMHDEVGEKTFIPCEEKSIKRIKKGVDKCLGKTRYVAAGLKRVKIHLGKIVEVLDKPEQSSQEGVASFKEIAEDLVKYVATGQRTKFEKEFVEAFCKYIDSKGEMLFNHLDIEGVPLTNNKHELTHMSIKHQLRRIIGHKAASHYLLTHGERIMFVNPNESRAGITRILTEMDQAAAMRLIESERKSRSTTSIVMHVVDKWKKKLASLRARFLKKKSHTS